MKNFVAQVAGIATLALGALPLAALTTAAHAGATIQIADLNLASAPGQAVFHRRLDAAGHRICASERTLRDQAARKAGVRAEADEQLAAKIPHAGRV